MVHTNIGHVRTYTNGSVEHRSPLLGRRFPRVVMVCHEGKGVRGLQYKDAVEGVAGAIRYVLKYGVCGDVYRPQGLRLEVVSKVSGIVQATVHWAAGYIAVEVFDPRTRKHFGLVQKRWEIHNKGVLSLSSPSQEVV